MWKFSAGNKDRIVYILQMFIVHFNVLHGCRALEHVIVMFTQHDIIFILTFHADRSWLVLNYNEVEDYIML